MKYQDIETSLRKADAHPELKKVIQTIHAEHVELRKENIMLAQSINKLLEMLNQVATIAGLHQQVIGGVMDGKKLEDVITDLRAEHLNEHAEVKSE